MINLAIVGLYNRGQQDEYVEMEAASSCSLSRFTLIRRVENEEVVFGSSRYLAKYLDMLAVLSLDTLPFMFTYFFEGGGGLLIQYGCYNTVYCFS